MTLFKKLAGKASALLNASGICSNNCIDGHCSGCGECCADLLPLTKGEIILTCDEYRKYRDYIPHYDSWIWTATPWYCGDEDSDTGCAAIVRSVDISSRFGCVGACINGAVAPACVLNPKFLNLRHNMAYVEEVSE